MEIINRRKEYSLIEDSFCIMREACVKIEELGELFGLIVHEIS